MPDVILPVLDEAEALPWVLSRMPPSHRAVVVDNGSTDGSGDIARSLGARVIEEPRRGYGAACNAGLEAADDEIVCFMDCDGSLDPSSLPLMTARIANGSAQLVLGRRIPVKGAWPMHARVANAVLAWHLRRTSGAQVHDISPMRAAGRDMLRSLELVDRRCGWPLEVILKAAHSSWQIDEVPVPYQLRYGRSKVTGTVRGSVQSVTDMWALIR